MTTRFSTWDELATWIGGAYEIVDAPADGGLLAFRPRDRDIKIGARRLVADDGAPWVMLCIKIGATSCIPPLAAMACTFDQPIGGYFTHRGAVGVEQKLPLAELSADVVRAVIDALIARAVEMRARHAIEDASVFDHFTE